MGGWVLSFVVAVFLLTAGCMPGRAARSAGQIGCSPDEISISDGEFQPGLIQSGETWVAECRGRTFYCTQIDGQPRKGQLFNLASDQISCREEIESPQAVRERDVRNQVGSDISQQTRAAAPTGAAGFDFGVTSEEAQRRCEIAGREWSTGAEGASCSGAAAELFMSANVQLGFCDGRTCRITVEHHPAGGWAARSVQLKAQLEAKYGSPASTSGSIPGRCRSGGAFVSCLETDALHLSYKWQWATGEALELEVGKPAPSLPPAIRLRYSRPRGTPNLSVL
jgi:hypothetical protein